LSTDIPWCSINRYTKANGRAFRVWGWHSCLFFADLQEELTRCANAKKVNGQADFEDLSATELQEIMRMEHKIHKYL
jgi:hypothetical protein